MPLNIKNTTVERLVDEVVQLTGETKTEAIHRALDERKPRLALKLIVSYSAERFRQFLEEEVWPLVPSEEMGHVLSRKDP